MARHNFDEWHSLDFSAFKSTYRAPGTISVTPEVVVGGVVAAVLLAIATVLGNLYSVLLTVGIVAIAYVCFAPYMQKADSKTKQLRRFCRVNGFTYSSKQFDYGEGSMFLHGHSGFNDFHVSGTLADLPFDFYVYEYTLGSGKSARNYDVQVMAIELPRKFPHFVIDSLTERGNDAFAESTLPIKFSKDQKIDLEGDFPDYFGVYAPSGRGIEALTILAPDAMAVIMDHAYSCDIEIIDNKLYFYWPDIANKRAEYEEIFAIVGEVLYEIGDKLLTMDITPSSKRVSSKAVVKDPEVHERLIQKRDYSGVFGVFIWVGMVVYLGSNFVIKDERTAGLVSIFAAAAVLTALFLYLLFKTIRAAWRRSGK